MKKERHPDTTQCRGRDRTKDHIKRVVTLKIKDTKIKSEKKVGLRKYSGEKIKRRISGIRIHQHTSKVNITCFNWQRNGYHETLS